MWFSCFLLLPGSAEAQVIWGGRRLLIAYFIGNISAKKISKSIHVHQSYSKSKVGRFLRHGVECMSEMCWTWLAGNAGPKKIAKNVPSGHHRTTLSAYTFAMKARIDSRKKFVKQQYNMVNFCPLTAEICWRVWGIPANVNGFRVLAALLHGTL